MKKKHDADPQEPGQHKVENDHNRTGHIGSDNQSQSRKGGVGGAHHGPKP